jgi:hypothetical protein
MAKQFKVSSFGLLRVLVASQVATGILHVFGTRPTRWRLLEAFPSSSVFSANTGLWFQS